MFLVSIASKENIVKMAGMPVWKLERAMKFDEHVQMQLQSFLMCNELCNFI